MRRAAWFFEGTSLRDGNGPRGRGSFWISAGAGCLALLCLAAVLPAQQPKGKAKAPKAAKAANKPADVPEEPELSQADILGDAAADDSAQVVTDIDETPEGRDQLRQVEGRAREIFRERDAINKERQKVAGPRDVLLGEIRILQDNIVQRQAVIGQLDKQAAGLQRQLNLASGDARANLQNQLANITVQAQVLNAEIGDANAAITERTPTLQALNNQVRPFDERLLKLWAELEESRVQWVKLRQPIDKYARGEFELLRRVLDAWLLIDGLWPEAYAWACLCAFELDDTELAGEYLQKAQDIRVKVWGDKKPWPPLEALSALLDFHRKGGTPKALAAVRKATNMLDKKTDWQTQFLIGRCYVDRESEVGKAQSCFEKALEIKPKCLCAKLWLARIQTTTTNERVRDVSGGTKTLESLWRTSGQRSWRQAWFLAEAYAAGDRKSEADGMWDKALELAPDDRQAELKSLRSALPKKSSKKTT